MHLDSRLPTLICVIIFSVYHLSCICWLSQINFKCDSIEITRKTVGIILETKFNWWWKLPKLIDQIVAHFLCRLHSFLPRRDCNAFTERVGVDRKAQRLQLLKMRKDFTHLIQCERITAVNEAEMFEIGPKLRKVFPVERRNVAIAKMRADETHFSQRWSKCFKRWRKWTEAAIDN